ncbi:hypothetical protein M9Y10_023661 [Tritrichomonas musculus]|uniref:Esterase Ig-like N-terminal domain-containing protein n=1 Tax=Tritrichomonas musculus TaxID=1915356 RepID=A0ABR2KVS4_9EUKA
MKDEYEKINDEGENQEACCSAPNRKQKIILITVFIIMGLIAISSLAVCFIIFLQNDAKVVTLKDINLTLIGDVFPDGEKITAIAVTFIVEDNEDPNFTIDNTKLSSHCFSVQERNITGIHSCSSLDNPHSKENGQYIILELNPNDNNSKIIYRTNDESYTEPSSYIFHIQQKADIDLINGNYIQKTAKIYSNDPDINNTINLVVDEFNADTFINPDDSTETLPYNIFIPKSIERSKPSKIDQKYPLILFIHDFSVVCNDPRMTLFQGIGGTIWATHEEQRKHESFVVAPCFNDIIVNGSYQHKGQYSLIMPLLNDLVNNKYKDIIDTDRIYITGQSMGSMASISLMCENPNFFASGLFVAGQWDVKIMENLINQSFWILCSEADEKSATQNDLATENLEKLGARIGKGRWSGKANFAERKKNVEEILNGQDNKFYVKFANHTVMPLDIPYNIVDEHVYTWKVAYMIEGVRNWLFDQKLN